jgi:hypothetical protein
MISTPAKPSGDWVQRPDVDGRMGWEPENLPEWRRWWAMWRFEDLPTGESLARKAQAARQAEVAEREQPTKQSTPKAPAKRSGPKRGTTVGQQSLI